jgi:hypothetical protein
MVSGDKVPFAWRSSADTERDLDRLRQAMEDKKYIRIDAADMRSLISRGQANALRDWPQFSNSWARLPVDLYMADGGRYRRRRYAVLSAAHLDKDLQIEAYEPHFQSVTYNNLNGGVLRYFELIEDDALRCLAMRGMLSIGLEIFSGLAPCNDWRIELHQFRIEAHEQPDSLPTPEGRHRDGASFVMMVMIERKNVVGGNTIVYGLDGDRLDEFVLSDPLDATFVNDEKIFHEVSPISLLEPGRPGHRDMFVAVFRQGSTVRGGTSPTGS